jgi:tetratricopeptide (TPR) repeat protein
MATRTLSLPALVFVAAALLASGVPMDARAGAAEDEAMRQLQLAKADLKMGKVDRAIQAANSARRLDPTLLDALLVNAQALKLKGELSQSRALVLAYQGAAGDDAVDEAAELLDRLDRAEPVRAMVRHLDDGTVEVTFAARDFLEDPTLHWKARGGWQSTWMELDERGEWIATIKVTGAQRRGVEWWVEPTLGRPVIEQLGKGEGRPFLLALK